MTFIIEDYSIKVKEDRVLFDNLCFTLEKNEILVIQGKSGCGKSTLLKSIAGFIEINKVKHKKFSFLSKRKWFQENSNILCNGNISLNDIILNDLDPRIRSIGYLMQNSRIYPHLHSPKAVLEFSYKINKRLQGIYSFGDFSKKARDIFENLNFHIDYNDKIENISGGEEQRLLLAKYLLLEPKILLLDEPFSNLDYIQRENIRNMIKEMIIDNDSRIEYVIMVSHDINDGKIADKILYFKDSTSNNQKMDVHLIEGNDFETSFDVFSRLNGNWTDKKDKIVKDNIITELISKLSNQNMVKDVFDSFLDTFKISDKKKNDFYNLIKNDFNSDLLLEQSIKSIISLDTSIYNNSLVFRADTIYEEINNYITQSKNILDIGCGDGRIANLISNNNEDINIELTDIYRHKDIELYQFPFRLMETDIILPYTKNTFDTSLLLTVLHHSNNPVKLLEETKRITNKRIIIIESVLGISNTDNGEFTHYSDKRLEYARLIDWIYNRIVYDDVNVPYNFLTVNDWMKVFDDLDLELIESIDLGIDIEIVPEHHYLFVLEKKASREQSV